MSITPENAMSQASMTAELYLAEAICSVDKLFGEGFAKKHPEIALGVAQIAEKDFANTTRMGAIDLPFKQEEESQAAHARWRWLEDNG